MIKTITNLLKCFSLVILFLSILHVCPTQASDNLTDKARLEATLLLNALSTQYSQVLTFAVSNASIIYWDKQTKNPQHAVRIINVRTEYHTGRLWIELHEKLPLLGKIRTHVIWTDPQCKKDRPLSIYGSLAYRNYRCISFERAKRALGDRAIVLILPRILMDKPGSILADFMTGDHPIVRQQMWNRVLCTRDRYGCQALVRKKSLVIERLFVDDETLYINGYSYETPAQRVFIKYNYQAFNQPLDDIEQKLTAGPSFPKIKVHVIFAFFVITSTPLVSILVGLIGILNGRRAALSRDAADLKEKYRRKVLRTLIAFIPIGVVVAVIIYILFNPSFRNLELGIILFFIVLPILVLVITVFVWILVYFLCYLLGLYRKTKKVA